MTLTVEQGTKEDWSKLKEEIRQIAPSLGIDKVGFTTADPFEDLKHILVEHRAKGYESGFEHSDLEKRVDPGLNFTKPKSIMSIAIAYPSKLVNPPKSEEGAYRGIISRSAWGEDYHHVLRRRLARLESFIHSRVSNATVESMVDTGALVDRAVAERAGIGWVGKNCSVITPEFGSWVYLGEMLTNINFPSDNPVTDTCGDCTICMDACPTGAIVGPGELNAQRCISYITQTKGWIADEFKEKIGNRLYGCDTCQVVCPKNKGKNWTHQPEFEPDVEVVKPLLKPLLTISNKEFREQFGRSASSWRGKKPLQRNAVIALGKFKDHSAIPLLEHILREDPRPVMRGTAAWALSKIGGDKSVQAIQQAVEQELDETVLIELKKAKKILDGGE